MLSSGNLGVGIGLDVLWRLNAAAVNYATTWSFATYAQANNGALPGPWADQSRTGTATYESSSGVITTLPDLGGGTYAARVQYRSGTARGLLIEGQATEYLGRTESFNTDWASSGVTVTENSVAAPDGATTADTLAKAAAGSFIYRGIASLSAGSYVVTVWLRAISSGGTFQIAMNGSGVSPNPTSTNVTVTTSWQRFTLPVTSVGGTVNVILGGYVAAAWSAGDVAAWGVNVVAGTAASSYITNSGTGTVVRKGDFEGVFLTSTALSAAFPGGVTAPLTTVFQYRKGYSVSSDETLFALSAGSSAGSTNLLALQVNGTQAQAVHSGGSGTLSGTLVHDGSTVNKIALSVDPTIGKVSVSVNGAASVETTGIAFTGSGTTHLIPGARTTGGDTPVAAMEIYDWRNVNTAYTTGASLQALSA